MTGNEDSTRQEVDNFYNFWYEFDSWREYSYLDEEDKDKGQDREERRWIEKQNRGIRLKRKKEEMARIRQLVDLAYNNDPRIVKFRNDDKEKKAAAKRAKMSVAQAARAEEERVVREAQAAKKEAEAAEKKRIEVIRQEKEQQKRALKKERKLLRDAAKENDYYSTSDTEKLRNMEGVEKICEMLKFLELQEFNRTLTTGGRDAFVAQLKDTEEKLEEERRALFDTKPAPVVAAAAPKTDSAVQAVDKNAMWNGDNMQLLIKAVNLFPAGTVQRWEVIANYLNLHATNLGNKKFMSRDVLNKAKDLQASDFAKNQLKSQANDDAFASFQKSKKELKIIDVADISVNNDGTPATTTPPTMNGGETVVKATPIKSSKKVAPAPEAASAYMPESARPKKEKTTTPTTNEKKSNKSQNGPKQNGIDHNKNNNVNNNKNNTNSSNNNNNHEKEIKVNGIEKPTKVAKEKSPSPAAAAATMTNGTESAAATTAAAAKTSWTKDEQALLEQAIKTYPITTADRWDRIAECLPNRTKKECLRRVKELVDICNARRDAQNLK